VDPQKDSREDPVKKAMDVIAKAAEAVQKAQEDLQNAEKAIAEHHQQLPEAKEYAGKYDELLKAGKLKRSAKVYDELTRYKSLVPKDNAGFRDFARKWWGQAAQQQGFLDGTRAREAVGAVHAAVCCCHPSDRTGDPRHLLPWRESGKGEPGMSTNGRNRRRISELRGPGRRCG